MNILEALQKSLDEQKQLDDNSDNNNQHMHPTVFRNALERLGCDSDTIEDCLFEETDKWEWLIQYFEDKNNEIKKDIKGD